LFGNTCVTSDFVIVCNAKMMLMPY